MFTSEKAISRLPHNFAPCVLTNSETRSRQYEKCSLCESPTQVTRNVPEFFFCFLLSGERTVSYVVILPSYCYWHSRWEDQEYGLTP